MLDSDAYLRAAYPPPLRPTHLSDEDISHALDRLPRRKRREPSATQTPGVAEASPDPKRSYTRRKGQ